MVRPQEVRAPKEKIEILAIIEDGTQTKKGYSIALVKWKGKKGVALRWDGDNQQDKGFPVTANGYHPAWFVLPDKFKSSPQSCVKVQPHQKHNVLRCEPNCHAFLSEERGQEQ
ncbi:hypothetical protein [Enterococcus faecium]|uniref:hypothetical protein n=1 Tax=Enterococcus faecium TaxID=1352 RepID=UPI00333BEE95